MKLKLTERLHNFLEDKMAGAGVEQGIYVFTHYIIVIFSLRCHCHEKVYSM
jgi:hypothetical protein